ncbi:MAG: hypothetical protein K2P76_07490 [Lachnospiraceae bacterium]|nr:hypothetical protein [Lachnospiraceae bacterium]
MGRDKEKAGRGMFFAILGFVGIPVSGNGAWMDILGTSNLSPDFKISVKTKKRLFRIIDKNRKLKFCRY